MSNVVTDLSNVVWLKLSAFLEFTAKVSPSNSILNPNISADSFCGLCKICICSNLPLICLYTKTLPWSFLTVSSVGADITTKVPSLLILTLLPKSDPTVGASISWLQPK